MRDPLIYRRPVDDLEQFPGCIDSLVSLGPGFLYRVLNATPRKRRNMVLIHSSFSLHTWVGDAVCMAWDEKLPLIFPADRYDVQTFEELWSRTTPIDGPNPAWTNTVLEDHLQGASFEAAFVSSEEFPESGRCHCRTRAMTLQSTEHCQVVSQGRDDTSCLCAFTLHYTLSV